MKTTKEYTKNWWSHLIWYALGATVPMVVGLLRTPIFTHSFSPKEMGIYELVNNSFFFVSLLLFSWINNCIWRFYNTYRLKNELNKFYASVFQLMAFSSVLLLAMGIGFERYFQAEGMSVIILFAMAYYLSNSWINAYFILVKLRNKSRQFFVLNSLRIGFSFLVLLFLLFVLEWGLAVVFISLVIIDYLIIITLSSLKIKTIQKVLSTSLHFLNTKPLLQVLLSYGLAHLLMNIIGQLLKLSDRYLILWFDSIDNVGIYGRNAQFASLSLGSLVMVFFNSISPSIMQAMEDNKAKGKELLNHYLFNYLVLFIAAVSFFILFAETINNFLFGLDFQEGYVVMPFIFLIAFFEGTFLFAEVPFKFENRINNIVLILASGFVLHVIISAIAIPIHGYIFAAISYNIAMAFVLGLAFYIQRNNLLKKFKGAQVILKEIGFFVAVALIHFFVIPKDFRVNLFYAIAEVLLILLLFIVLFRNTLLQVKSAIFNA